MARHPSFLERRFNRRRWAGLLFLFVAMTMVAAVWALMWTRDSRRIREEMDRYTREEVLTLARLLLYDLAVDERLEEIRFLEGEICAMEEGRPDGFERPMPELTEIVEDRPDLPDGLLWKAALDGGLGVTLMDVTGARYHLYRAEMNYLAGRVEEDLWARVTFSDHLRAVRILSIAKHVDIRAGEFPLEEDLAGDPEVIREAGPDLLGVYLPLHVHARRWGWAWCILNRSVITQVTDRLQRSLLASQIVLALVMAVFLGSWVWLGMVVLRQLKREVVDPVVALARRMEAWEQPSPQIAPDKDETVWLSEAFGRLLERVHNLLRDRDLALEQVQSQQEQLLKAERLGLLERIGSGLSHELNNALNPARLRLEEIRLASRKVEREDVEALLDHLTSAQTILKDLAASARRPAGGFRPVPKKDWIEVAVRLLGPQFREGPRWEIEVPEDLPEVLGDPQALIQIVMNLVLNAREAALERADGTGSVRVSCRVKEGFVILEVEDDGPGVPDQLRGRLFEPFVSTKPHGSGLGLFLVESQVKRMGGWVSLRETTGEKTIFEVGIRCSDGTDDEES